MESGKHHDTDMEHDKKGCNDCGSNQNTNYAPVNTNVQNFVNIETDIDTNINVNMGKASMPHGMPHGKPQQDMGKLMDMVWGWAGKHGEDMKDQDWGWAGEHGDAMKDHDWGFDSELSVRDVMSFLGQFGIDCPEDLFEMLEKEDVKKTIMNLLKQFMPEHGNDTHHDDHHDDHTNDHDDHMDHGDQMDHDDHMDHDDDKDHDDKDDQDQPRNIWG